MLRVLKLLAFLPLLFCAHVFAVSLGDELILSRLGDPVEIEIEVLQWEDMDLDRVQISPATREEYAVFDLTWLPVLEELSFNMVGPDLDGKVRVLISSRAPLTEPFLELLLVLRWPGGSLRREYVLLFDPPEAALSAVTAPLAESPVPETTQTVPPAPSIAEPASEPPAAAPVSPEPVLAESETRFADARTQVAIEVETLTPQSAPAVLDSSRRTYQVRADDSLWNIARQLRPAGAGENLYQMLLGIHDLNRGSFINGNISLLKANALLQVPTENDIAAIDPRGAQAEFDRRWGEGTQRFDAVQRGEAIPLFVNESQPQALSDAVEDDLPPGMEAPAADETGDGLIMVSRANVLQPLRIASDGTAGSQPVDVAGRITQSPAQVAAPQIGVTTTITTTTTTTTRTISRSAFAAELETEIAAMRARRQSAEALAQELQVTLEQAQIQRAAQASIMGSDNLLLAGSALLLLVGLVTTSVFSLKVAGELKLQNNAGGTFDKWMEPAWLTANAAGPAQAGKRREPHMPEMDVVKLQMPEAGHSKDLFARMDDILDIDGNSAKSR